MSVLGLGIVAGCLLGKACISGDAVWAVAAGLVSIASAILDATERRKGNA